MKIEIISKNPELTHNLQTHIARQVEFGLSRLSSHIRKVSVRLSNIDGPHGGVVQRCQLVISLNQLPDVMVEDVASDLIFAINRTADRANRTVSRKINQIHRVHSTMQTSY
ncbi:MULTISPECIES: HPF/RaiA family ribosome-associated protein [Deefgea]|uniref:Ribosome-associated translation inhibitor RaiA n=1 Tax=Deefgea chitinilytica TaxID=570276 RepID=A0ABS2CEY6_9NEIS|nr:MULTISPECIES: HPF/RaiA family ribosome-associated protein [Deefgea]MBM5572716.1 hypothetical protein [Deefgea chitinilytica]MBM9889952.1 HPF/RaiA family ribosome-associated protein [Deefgea sp. CFH1-16]